VTQEPKISIDLNADLGEHDGSGYATDLALLDVVSSASIACGAHAGSPDVMRSTVSAALERGVSIGAHPGYPDRQGFGRRELGMTVTDILDSFARQLDLIARCCTSEGARLGYVKPHGALYNRAVKDRELAHELAAHVAHFDESLAMLALAGSMLEQESRSSGLAVAREAFIDRAYLDDGTLVPRDREGAVIDDAVAAAARAVEMARGGAIATIDGTLIRIAADSLCVHGDSQNALPTIRLAKANLEAAGFAVRAFSAKA
jgi:UPF0271 protein